MTTKEMVKMRIDGATYQEIADACGISRAAAHKAITQYFKREANGVRGKGFCLYDVKNDAIREYFADHHLESVSSFSRKAGVNAHTMRAFLYGKTDSHFSVSQIRRICEIVGKPFEEVFGGADGDESEADRQSA